MDGQMNGQTDQCLDSSQLEGETMEGNNTKSSQHNWLKLEEEKTRVIIDHLVFFLPKYRRNTIHLLHV